MIIVRLTGGLGNQLFQYAFGRRLALQNHTKLKLDTSYFPTDTQRGFMLDAFAINASVATKAEIEYFTGSNRVTRKIKRFLGRHGLFPFVQEPHFSFWQKALETTDPAYLDGYWQSETYFAPAEAILRSELVLVHPLSEPARTLQNAIKESVAVSIHVRRGDYLNSQFSVLDQAYYTRAIEHVSASLPQPTFFVFSDDIARAKNDLQLPPSTMFVSDQQLSAQEELVLMSECQHHIIANSSFSWWGAWLNSNPEKIVVAPKRWFVLDVHNTKDLVPERWFTT